MSSETPRDRAAHPGWLIDPLSFAGNMDSVGGDSAPDGGAFGLLPQYTASLLDTWLWSPAVASINPPGASDGAVANTSAPLGGVSGEADPAANNMPWLLQVNAISLDGANLANAATAVTDSATGAHLAQNTYDADGVGITIGIRPGGFNPLSSTSADSTAGNASPANNTGIPQLQPGGNGEALPTAQVVQDVAPGPRIGPAATGSMLPPVVSAGTFADTSTPAGNASGDAGLVADDMSAPLQIDVLSSADGLASAAATILADDNSDIAMGANLARQTYGVDGAGIKIGILSDSFNVTGGMAADIAAGNLPPAADIDILKEGPTTGQDEGRAMAQLIYKIAPDAQIYFYTAVDGESDFAAGIQALAAAGCNIIVDDVTYFYEPFYQGGDPVQAAVASVVSQGVDYFTAAGNNANNYYENSWTGMTTRLPGVKGSVTAFNFGKAAGGTSSPYETVTIAPGGTVNLVLQWDQPFASIGSGHSPDNSLSFYMYSNGKLFESSTSDPEGLDNPVRSLSATNTGSTSITVQIAVVDASGPAPGLFKIIDFDDGYGGSFDDPNAGIGTGTVTGHAMVPVANTVGAVDYTNTPAFGVSPPVLESFSSVGGGEFLFDSSGNRLASPETTGTVDFTAPDGSATSVFDPFYGTSAAAPDAAGVAALMLQADPTLTPAQVTSDIDSTALAMNGSTAADGAGFIQALPAVELAEQTSCYAAGTRILTPHGAVPIEQLRIGDPVVTMSGTLPVHWIGWRRVNLRRHKDPAQARPIRIRRGAFASNLPQRDLLVSPEHAVFVDGVLIPARLLVNHGSIAQDQAMNSVHYYHLELPHHAILFADGLPVESYLDTGNRSMFANGGGVTALHPEFAIPADLTAWERDACAPLATDAQRVRPVWQRLADRARDIGFPVPAVTRQPNLHLVTPDGSVVWPVIDDFDRCVFVLPNDVDAVQLRSRAAAPADTEPWATDRRRLGACVTRLITQDLTGRTDIPLDHPSLRDGWWDVERAEDTFWRWTDGDAILPLARGTVLLEIHLTGSIAYRLSDDVPCAVETRRAWGRISAKNVC